MSTERAKELIKLAQENIDNPHSLRIILSELTTSIIESNNTCLQLEQVLVQAYQKRGEVHEIAVKYMQKLKEHDMLSADGLAKKLFEKSGGNPQRMINNAIEEILGGGFY